MKKQLLSAIIGGVMLFSTTALAGCDTSSLNQFKGSTWYNGTESPAANYGNKGDYFFETDTHDVWYYGETGWQVISNLKGATGETGEQGEPGKDAESPEFVVEKDYKLTTSLVLYSDSNYPLFEQGTFPETFCGPMTFDSCVIKVEKEIITLKWTQTNEQNIAVANLYFKARESEKLNPTYDYESCEVYLNDVLATDLSDETLNSCMNTNILNEVLYLFSLGETFFQILAQGSYLVGNLCIIDRETHHSYYVAQGYGF